MKLQQDYEVVKAALDMAPQGRWPDSLDHARLTRLRDEAAKVPGLEARVTELEESLTNVATDRDRAIARIATLEREREADRYAIHGALSWSGCWEVGYNQKPSRPTPHVAALLERLAKAEAERDAAQQESDELIRQLRQERNARLDDSDTLSALRERVATLERRLKDQDDEHHGHIRKTSDHIRRLEQERDAAQQKAATLRESVATIQGRRDRAEQATEGQRQRADAARQEAASERERTQAITTRLEVALGERDHARDENERLTARASELEARADQRREHLLSVEDARKAAEARATAAEARVRELVAEVDRLNNRLADAYQEYVLSQPPPTPARQDVLHAFAAEEDPAGALERYQREHPALAADLGALARELAKPVLDRPLDAEDRALVDAAWERIESTPPAPAVTSQDEDGNVCEHGDHAAPEGKRYCSAACQQCDGTDYEGDAECAGICSRQPPTPPALVEAVGPDLGARILDAVVPHLTVERGWWPVYLNGKSGDLWVGERGYDTDKAAWSVANRRAEDCSTYVAVRFGSKVVVYGGKDFVLAQRDLAAYDAAKGGES